MNCVKIYELPTKRSNILMNHILTDINDTNLKNYHRDVF